MKKAELKRIRLELGLSQSGLARHLDTPRSTYVKWERGENRIPGVVKIALDMVRRRVKMESKKGEKKEVNN